MSILEGIGAANALIRGAANLVREIKRPKVENGAFQALMNQQMQSPEAREANVIQKSDQFMRLRDANADSLLSRDESGLNEAQFNKLDTNADGKLSVEELRQPYLEALHRQPGIR